MFQICQNDCRGLDFIAGFSPTARPQASPVDIPRSVRIAGDLCASGGDNMFASLGCRYPCHTSESQPNLSLYRIGIAVVFQHPACITDARSMLGANMSIFAPTRIE
jgi:hypothetical protein